MAKFDFKKIEIFGLQLSIITYKEILSFLAIKNRRGYATLNSVHGLMESQNDNYLRKSINQSTFSLCDGRPIFWLLKKKYQNSIDHITGRILMLKVCEMAEQNNYSIGIYGGSKTAQYRCISKLKTLYPNLKISFAYSPNNIELKQKESIKILNLINRKQIHFLFVCLGCPKQEVWMNMHIKDLSCFMFGVGAAIDYIAETIKPPPKIITKVGLEWLYRLIIEPKRLYRRYFYIIPSFIMLIIKSKFMG